MIHRAAMAYAHLYVNDATLDQMLKDGRWNVDSGKYKLLCVYFAAALKRHLGSHKIDLGICRTKKQIAQGLGPKLPAGTKDLPGQRFFDFDGPQKRVPKPHFDAKPAATSARMTEKTAAGRAQAAMRRAEELNAEVREKQRQTHVARIKKGKERSNAAKQVRKISEGEQGWAGSAAEESG